MTLIYDLFAATLDILQTSDRAAGANCTPHSTDCELIIVFSSDVDINLLITQTISILTFLRLC